MPKSSGTLLLSSFLLVIGISYSFAHLEPGSLSSPQEGASYPAGSPLRITWVQAEYHFGKYALAWSKDGGTTWDSIATWNGPSGDGVTVNYAWTVPDAPGQARVRICQLGECNDPDYRLVSGAFTIAPASAVRPQAPSAAEGLILHSAQGMAELSFSLEQGGDVVLEALDARGMRVAVLMEGRFAAGRHAAQVESPLLKSGRPLFMVLRQGGRILAEASLP